jgi:hypothetical protein
MMKQVSGAQQRTIKPTIDLNTPLRFTPEEVIDLADSMKAYVGHLCSLLDQQWGTGSTAATSAP